MGWLNINGNWIGRHSGKSVSSYWTQQSIFKSGALDFESNQLLDVSGNSNHLLLKNASARLGNTNPASNNLLTSLIHAYNFDEASGNLIDGVGDNDGVVTGATMAAIGKFGYAYTFDGNDSVSLSNTDTFATTDSFTISGWIKITTLAGGGDNYIADRTTNINSLVQVWRSNNDLTFRIRGANSVGICSVTYADILTAGSWIHFIAERDVSTDKINLWVNNVAAGEGVTDATTVDIGPFAFKFGNNQAANGGWLGELDEIMIWKRVLTSDEKTFLYNSGKGCAYPFNIGNPLDYYITGLLVTDTIEVAEGSDTPTIPTSGILRINGGQTVYGVTIKRDGVIWAIYPFCEIKYQENLPYRSFDVSGNGHHGYAYYLVDENITTQSNYFHLMRYGYSIGSENILGWDTTQWTGDISTYNAVFQGAVLPDAQAENIRHIQPTDDGEGCRLTSYQTYNMNLRSASVLTVGKRYRFKVRTENHTSTVVAHGLHAPTMGIDASTTNWVVGDGDFSLEGVATLTYFGLVNSNNTSSPLFRIDFYSPTLQLAEIVPGSIDGVNDAIGNLIEFPQDGYSLLKYAGYVQAPNAMIEADQKGYWSAYMNQGLCVSGNTYLIERTETDHFGTDKLVFDEFIADGTEVLDDDNVVRELILHEAERGFFFDDDESPHLRSYDDFVNIKHHFIYCSKLKTEELHTYDPLGINGKPADGGYGFKRYVEANTLKDIYVLKNNVFVTEEQRTTFNAQFNNYEELDFAMVSYVFDSWATDDYAPLLAAFEARHFKVTRALYFSNNVTKEQTDAVQTAGHEVIPHTPGFGGIPLGSYKDFHEGAVNYNEAELRTYYSDIVAYMTTNGYKADHKILPGGLTDALNQSVVLDYFKSAWEAVGSVEINLLPIVRWNVMGRNGNDFKDATDLANAKTDIDDLITARGWSVFYGHTYSHSEDSLSNFGEWLDYIAAKIAAGEKIRFVKMEDAYNILKKLK